MKILITGGAGFIGGAVVRELIELADFDVINLDKLTYAGNLDSLKSIADSKRYYYEQVDICDAPALGRVFEQHQPSVIMHLAAESHVDRSIDGPSDFIETNIKGTFNLLNTAKQYLENVDENKRNNFRFIHVSTDEVYGDLKSNDDLFTETTKYAPSSPYAASKAASDHLVRAWHRTYQLPTIITNCSNNYGPYQFPEKLIPKMIINIFSNKELPIYAKGKNSREWIYVDDHCEALFKLYLKGKNGESYNVGSNINLRNIDLVKKILKTCKKMKIKIGSKTKIKYVKDRPGHDFRYALNNKKIFSELKWKPKFNFETGLESTVAWYLENEKFFKNISNKSYEKRLGLKI